MPHKICKACQAANGVRAGACKECGASFAVKKKAASGAAAIKVLRSRKDEIVAEKMGIDNPKFYERMMVGVSAQFTYGEEEDDLAASIAQQRGLVEADVKTALSLTINQMWKKKWKSQ